MAAGRLRWSAWVMNDSKKYGGQTGIRTLDTLRYTRFPSVRLQPLGHLSAQSLGYRQPSDFITWRPMNDVGAYQSTSGFLPSFEMAGLMFKAKLEVLERG